ncbi:MAG: hypothetical protein ABSA11_10945 [Candidatus Bathyarchaeia archaeon]
MRAQVLGFAVRVVSARARHDPSEPPDWAVKEYGVETARRVMEDHVSLDGHDFLAEMRRRACTLGCVSTLMAEMRPCQCPSLG